MICGPIYTIADIFEDEQFRAREMLVKHEDPEFGEYIGPGIVPKFSRDAGRGALVGDLGGGQPQPGGLRRPARPVRRRARRPARRRASCDRAGPRRSRSATSRPRDGLQNDADDRSSPDDARRAGRPPRGARAAAHRGRSASSTPRACRRWRARRRSSPAIERREGVVYAGLVLNERGYERLAATGLDEVHFAFAATETFNQRNQNAARRGVARRRPERIVERAHADGLRATVTIGASFGCPFEGAVDPGARARARRPARRRGRRRDRLRRHDRRRRAAPGASSSWRGPRRSARPVGVHLHNTRNTGFANAFAALEAGATVLDASVGGIGGCPFAPRATGNICTEDLVYLLHGEGVETGIDLDALIDVAEWLEGVLGRQLEGQVYRAGTFAAGRAAEERTRRAHGVQARSGRGRHVHRPLPRLRRERRAQYRVKTPSTPADPSEGVLDRRPPHLRRGGDRGRGDPQHPPRDDGRDERRARVEGRARRPDHDEGFKQILHLARSQTPGPLAGWIIMIKPDPPASLADTREAVERMDARGDDGRAGRRGSRSRASSATSSSRASSR